MKVNPKLIEGVTKALIDEGKIIEAGFVSLRHSAYPGELPPAQLEEMRNCFFAGAQHLFGSMMTMLDPGLEETEADLERMSKINDELQRFIKDFATRRIPTVGGLQ